MGSVWLLRWLNDIIGDLNSYLLSLTMLACGFHPRGCCAFIQLHPCFTQDDGERAQTKDFSVEPAPLQSFPGIATQQLRLIAQARTISNGHPRLLGRRVAFLGRCISCPDKTVGQLVRKKESILAASSVCHNLQVACQQQPLTACSLRW